MTSAAGTIAWVAAQAGIDLPVRVRAWDGSEAGPPGAPVAVLRSPRAAAHPVAARRAGVRPRLRHR